MVKRKDPRKTSQVTTQVSSELYKYFDDEARDARTSVAEQVRRAIEDWYVVQLMPETLASEALIVRLQSTKGLTRLGAIMWVVAESAALEAKKAAKKAAKKVAKKGAKSAA